jgi:hypothetical protein
MSGTLPDDRRPIIVMVGSAFSLTAAVTEALSRHEVHIVSPDVVLETDQRGMPTPVDTVRMIEMIQRPEMRAEVFLPPPERPWKQKRSRNFKRSQKRGRRHA